jgi:hypothetical protein
MRDFRWWSKTLWRIAPNVKKRGYVPFEFNEIQEKVYHDWGLKNAIPKPRRIGMSTYGISDVAHTTLTMGNIDSLVVGNEKSVAMNLLDILNRGYNAMPDSITIEFEGEKFQFACKPLLKNESKLEFRCIHDWESKHPKSISKVMIATAKGEHAVGRSLGIGKLLITEAGMPEYWDGQAFYSASQGLPEDESGTITCEGSPYGAMGWFYKMVKAARRKRNDYVYHWHTWLEYKAYQREPRPGDILEPICNEEYELVYKYGATLKQMLWARYKVKNYFAEGKTGDPWKLFGQEYPVDENKCWLMEGRSFFSAALLEWGLERAEAQFKILEAAGRVKRYRVIETRIGFPQLTEDASGPWIMIEKPIPGYPYLMTGDPAEGLNDSNPSAAIIWKPQSLGPHRAIGYFNEVIAVDDFEKNEKAMGAFYNFALIANEANNGGLAVNALLARDGYPNLYRMPHSAKGELRGTHEHRYGFWSGETSKQIALITLTRGLLENYHSGGMQYGTIDIPLPEVWEQLGTFSHLGAKKLGGAEAPDDLVSCCWIGSWELLEGLSIEPPRNDDPFSDLKYLKAGEPMPADRIEAAFPEPVYRRRRFA